MRRLILVLHWRLALRAGRRRYSFFRNGRWPILRAKSKRAVHENALKDLHCGEVWSQNLRVLCHLGGSGIGDVSLCPMRFFLRFSQIRTY
jgi:hypothetical protein